MQRSQRGRCIACDHRRVAIGFSRCPLCLFRHRLRYVKRWLQRYGKRTVTEKLHEPSASRQPRQYVTARSLAKLTAADLGRARLVCWLCGEAHARVVCPRERKTTGSGTATTRHRNDVSVLYSWDFKEAARRFRQWLVAEGWLED